MAYDAGTAFLQIVPSFRGIDEAVKTALRRMGVAINNAVGDALPQGVAKGAQRAEQEAEKAGRGAGQRYAGAFVKEIQGSAKKAADALPDIKLKADPDEIDRAVEHIRVELAKISDANIDIDFDSTEALGQLIALRAELRALQQQARERPEVGFDTNAAADALKSVDTLLEDIDRRGFEAFGKFSKGFNEAAKSAHLTLPEFEATDAVQRELADIRAELEHQSKIKLNIDVDEDSAIASMRALVTRLNVIAKDAPLRQVREDAAAAAKDLESFLGQDAGEEAGHEYGGAFAAELKKIIVEAQAAIGEVDLTVDVNASPAAVKLAVLKGELEDLNKLIVLGLDPTLILARLKEVGEEIREIQRAAADDIELNFDADSAAKALEKTRELERKAQLAGLRAGGAFNEGFQQRIAAAETAIGDVKIDADSTEFDRRLVEIKTELAELKTQRIGVDLDVDEARRRAKRLEELLFEIARSAPKIEQRYDAEKARAQLAGFVEEARSVQEQLDAAHADALKEQAGRDQADQEELGKRSAGSFADGYKKVTESARGKLPEIEIDADSSLAEYAIENTRRQLADLSDKTIGIDISADEADRRLKALREGLDKFAKDVNLPRELRFSARDAIKDIDKFYDEAGDGASELQARLRAALRDLPDIAPDVDATRAQQGLQEIKAALEKLRDQNINLEIDDAHAEAKLEELRVKLAQLAQNSPDLQVRVDSARALAQLEEVRRAANDADRAIGDTGLSAGAGIGRLATLVLTGISLGTVVAPAAAAAAAAIGTIGAVAGGAVVGVGVLALGLFGIADAVQALNKSSLDQAKTAKSLGAANKALLTAQDSARTAEGNLTSARQNAADSAIDAAQRVDDAERGIQSARETAADNNVKASRSLKEAQDTERESREALNEAIKAAKQDMQDLDLQVQKNSLDQRKATTAIAQERAKLDAVLSNTRSTQVERDAAQEAYDERVLQLKGLQLEGRKLNDKQKDYSKRGIEASDKLRAARTRETQAQQRLGDAEKNVGKVRKDGADTVAKAQRSLADAQRAQTKSARDSARSITAAQQQIVTANRAVSQAILGSGAAGGAALDNLNEAMAKLSPRGQEFAEFIFGLKGDFKQLTDAAQNGLLPGVQTGITNLLKYLDPFTTFVRKVGGALGGIFVDFTEALDDPVWQQFFGYFDETAVPTMETLATITGNVATAVANLFLAMTPFNDDILGGLVDGTAAFAKWAEQLTLTHGYIDFLEYVARVGPKVVELILNMGEFIGRIVTAAAPIGEKVVDALNDLFDALNSISVLHFSEVLGLLAVMATGSLIVASFGGAFRLVTRLMGPFFTLAKAIWVFLSTRYLAGINAVSTATDTLTRRQKAAAFASGAFNKSMSRAAGLATIAGVAITVLAIAYGNYQSKQDERKARVDDLSDSLNQLGYAYKTTGSLTSEASQDVIKANKPLGQLILDTDKYGISMDQVAKAASGNATAQGQVVKAYDEQIKKLEEQAEVAKKQKQADRETNPFRISNPFSSEDYPWSDANTDAQKNLDGLREQRQALQDNWLEVGRSEKAQELLNKQRQNAADIIRIQNIPAQAELDRQLETNRAEIQKLTTYIDNHSTAQGRAANLADAFTTSLANQKTKTGELVTANAKLVDGQEDFASGLISLRDSVKAATEAKDKDAKSLTFNSTELEKNSATAIANRDAIQGLAAQSRDAFLADIESGVGVDKARAAHDKRIESLKREAAKLGLNKDAVDALIESQGKIDPKITTKYEEENFAQAYEKLQRLNFIQEMIKQGKSAADAEEEYAQFKSKLDVQTITNNAQDLRTKGKAAGGPITGPGSKTSDSVPIWASTGEFMQKAAAVDYYGSDFMHAVNNMMIPKDLAQYARGGPIGKPKETQYAQGYAKGGAIAPIVIDYSKMVIDAPTKAEAKQIALDEIGGSAFTSGGVASGDLNVARIAENTARKLKATNKQLLALIEAGLVESGLRNLSYGDRDSLGFLQQRASWGTAAQRQNPEYATRKFINKAKQVDRASYTAGELAQAVQVSAFPDRYDKRAADAYAVINREAPFIGGGSALGGKSGGRGWKWQINVLREAFPGLALYSGFRNSQTLSGNLSWHGRDGGRAVDVPPARKIGEWISKNYGAKTIELITPWRELNLKNGKHHKYSAAVEAQHGVGAAGNDHTHWAYDQGGWLPPGYNHVVNATGKPEAVFTASQFQDIRSLADATRASVLSQSSTVNGATYQFDFANSTLDQSRLTAMQQRSDSLARVNRPNY
ncbi:MAG: hypothetical protein ABWY93_18925 [Mycobacterium sp.]